MRYTSGPRMDGSVAGPSPGTRTRTASRCPICDHGERRARFPATALSWVVECESCGLCYAGDQPSDVELQAIYDEHYYEQFGFVEGPHANDAGLARTKKATFASILRAAQPYLPTTGSTRKLLDVG